MYHRVIWSDFSDIAILSATPCYRLAVVCSRAGKMGSASITTSADDLIDALPSSVPEPLRRGARSQLSSRPLGLEFLPDHALLIYVNSAHALTDFPDWIQHRERSSARLPNEFKSSVGAERC